MMCLGSAVRTLSLGKGKFGDRMAVATYPLVGLRPEDFPERIRGRATKVLSARGRVAERHTDNTTYNFGRLKLRERQALIEDILTLYAACLIDLGSAGEHYNFMYPTDRCQTPAPPAG